MHGCTCPAAPQSSSIDGNAAVAIAPALRILVLITFPCLAMRGQYVRSLPHLSVFALIFFFFFFFFFFWFGLVRLVDLIGRCSTYRDEPPDL